MDHAGGHGPLAVLPIDLSFSTYNAATNFYRTDPLHFKSEVGVRFMNAGVLPFASRVVGEKTPPGPETR